MKGGLSWCWDRVSGRMSKQVMGYPCIRQPKRKLPENGSLHFIFVVKKGPGESTVRGLGLFIDHQKPAFV